MISKELISAVLDIIKPHNIRVTPRIIVYDRYKREDEGHVVKDCQINTYEFMYRCKEWMIKSNMVITTWNLLSTNEWFCTSSMYNIRIVGDTELEAVVGLAEYILKEQKN